MQLLVELDGVPIEMAPNAVTPGFTECRPAVFVIPSGNGWSLEIDDVPMPANGDRKAVWIPGFFAGQVVARLREGSTGREIEYRLEVSPEPGKLRPDVFKRMLQDIRLREPELLLGTEPARDRMGNLGRTEDSYVAFCRLRVHGPGFLKALRTVAREPIRTLRHQRIDVPLHAVRRADARSLQQGLKNPHLAALLAGKDEPDYSSPSGHRLEVPIAEPDLDNPANRCVTAMISAVLRRVKECRKRLLQDAAEESDDPGAVSSLKARQPVRDNFLRQLQDALQEGLWSLPFRAVSRAEVTPAGLNAVAAHPLYSRAYRIGWRCIRRGFAGEPSEDDLYLSPTWQLYERWAYLQVVEALRQAADATAAHTPIARDKDDHWIWTGRLLDGRMVCAHLQLEFRHTPDREYRGFGSLSRRRIPDIVLTLDHDGHRRFIILDAKYRTTRENVLEAMGSSHIYHDSLRWDGRVPDRSLLLVPAGGGAPWLEDPAFHKRHGVGVVVLAPDDPTNEERMNGILDAEECWNTSPELRDECVSIGSPNATEPDEKEGA